MNLTISPLDGRYRGTVADVRNHFSEFALMRNKVEIEIKYFMWFNIIIGNDSQWFSRILSGDISNIYNDFSQDDYEAIQELDKQIKHDIKAVQRFVQKKLEQRGCPSSLIESVHWGLTSQDIVNTSYYMATKRFVEEPLVNMLTFLTRSLEMFIGDDRCDMVAYTHGQPAIKTTFNNEMAVYLYRINNALKHVDLHNPAFMCKFGGAIGTLAGHKSIYPNVDWDKGMSEFCMQSFGLTRCELSTQVENYQSLCEFLDVLRNVSNILTDLCKDMWLYAFNGNIKMRYVEGETGSSTMTHKINPISFENAEGNFEICNSMIEFMTRKLAVSRLQRDLSDSTVIRNLGVVFGHFTLAIKSLSIGLDKISFDATKSGADIDDNGKIYTEYVQLHLKAMGYTGVDDIVSNLFRNNVRCTTSEFCEQLKSLSEHGIYDQHIKTMVDNINAPGFYAPKPIE